MTTQIEIRPFKEKHVYAGTVTNQELTFSKDDMPRLIITVSLTGELMNRFKPSAGLLDCPKVQAEVFLSFPTDNENQLKISAEALKGLGFESDDLNLLHPDTKGHVSFVGKEVYVTPSYRHYNDEEKLFWNFRFPKPFENKPVPKDALKKLPAASAYKALLAQQKEDAKKGTTAPF